MKFLQEQYRTISICLSLVILALAFVIGSDEKWRPVCVPLVFFAGFLMYGAGAIREWKLNRRTSCIIDVCLMICMWTAAILSLIGIGGVR